MDKDIFCEFNVLFLIDLEVVERASFTVLVYLPVAGQQLDLAQKVVI